MGAAGLSTNAWYGEMTTSAPSETAGSRIAGGIVSYDFAMPLLLDKAAVMLPSIEGVVPQETVRKDMVRFA